jgi:homoserine dehydrogenase
VATSVQFSKKVDREVAPVRKVAIAGFGTVGQAVAKILSERYQERFEVTHVYNRDVERKRVSWLSSSVQWTENIDDVLTSDVDVFLELAGGLSPAESWVRGALESGKSVVTANKQLIAHQGPALIELAHRNGQEILFGASVAGGVPVLSGLQHGLAGDRLVAVHGILNGTCNFILTKIEREGATFADALEHAQALGYAEAQPAEDVDGYDARAKLTILSRVALNTAVMPDQIKCRSIRTIQPIDFEYAHDLKCTIRQISRAEVREQVLSASVAPALVTQDSPLAGVQGGQNLVVATGISGGDIVFSGAGAGGNPTAVAVVSDLLALAHISGAPHPEEHPAPASCVVNADFTTAQYVRFTVADRPGIIAAIARIFSEHQINIDSILQKPGYSKSSLPFVITLEPCSTASLEKALAEIEKLDFNVQPPLNLAMMA